MSKMHNFWLYIGSIFNEMSANLFPILDQCYQNANTLTLREYFNFMYFHAVQNAVYIISTNTFFKHGRRSILVNKYKPCLKNMLTSILSCVNIFQIPRLL